METELLKFGVQLGIGGVFFWLWWLTRQELQALRDKRDQDNMRHDQDIDRLYGQRVNDLKFIAKLPTDLEGDYKMGPDSRVKA